MVLLASALPGSISMNHILPGLSHSTKKAVPHMAKLKVKLEMEDKMVQIKKMKK